MALLHEDVTSRIISVYYDVYNELGHGFLESICQTAMVIALTDSGLSVAEKVPLAVSFRGVCIGQFEPDLIVNGIVLVEIKAGSTLHPWHEAQVLNYLRASSLEVGLLLNFGPKPEHRRKILTTTASASGELRRLRIRELRVIRGLKKPTHEIRVIRGLKERRDP